MSLIHLERTQTHARGNRIRPERMGAEERRERERKREKEDGAFRENARYAGMFRRLAYRINITQVARLLVVPVETRRIVQGEEPVASFSLTTLVSGGNEGLLARVNLVNRSISFGKDWLLN